MSNSYNIKKYLGYKKFVLVQYISLIFQNMFVRFILYKKPKYNTKYKLSICGIFKNEAPFLKEWIEYHLMVGVEHFYLYNNNSSDNYLEVLKPYTEIGKVTLIDWSYNHAQMAAYKDFHDKYRVETQWYSFLDIDEFFCPIKKNNLLDWLLDYERYPVIRVYFKMFGTSGRLKHEYDKLQIEQYFSCWKGLFKVGKCLINSDYEIAAFNSTTHHSTKIIYPFWGINLILDPINSEKKFIKYDFNLWYNDAQASMQINHYWSRAWDAYEIKRNMTDVYFKTNPKADLDFFYDHEERNIDHDFKIFRFIIKLKFRMLQIRK